MSKNLWMRVIGPVGIALVAVPAGAQVRTVDPSAAMNRDPAPADGGSYDAAPAVGDTGQAPATAPRDANGTLAGGASADSDDSHPVTAPGPTVAATGATYQQSDVMDAAEGVFGRGAEGLAKIVEKILREQGEPSAYIAGREAGAAFAVGLRYGSGVMHHKVEGDRPVYWTGPSLGFDFGGNGAKSFILVYNLYDSQELFHRYPAAEGAAYLIGGFTASYLRRKDVVLIPIRLGVGWRLGANVGYLKFTEESKWMPF
ncbi:DUF1134 domain-containing protein [Sphingomonas solaris]|uniref:DUF1134 domain-containing protein n=1 Tax=Alterirhizorhabdus solaris TaxID=2529389 RepID=A0A558R5B4_9SPHN|nr:DUF1134 domain-containing protein [Sphingomonas solaris]TVV74580.1 DUF1134 domain-containing protein [Sphingomonas solaris]